MICGTVVTELTELTPQDDRSVLKEEAPESWMFANRQVSYVWS